MASTSGRISLRAIAEEAGVSRMTVSLALRNHLSLSEETRKQIQATARKLGYRADPVVSDLMTRLRSVTRTQHIETIAVITNQYGKLSWRDFPTYRGYFEGARDRAEQFGYSLEEFRLDEKGLTSRRLSQILWTRGIEGVLIFPHVGGPGFFDLQLDWPRFFSATIAFSLHHPVVHRCCSHHAWVVMEAYRQLAALGYRRPGLAIEGHQDERSGHHWRAGFLCAQDLSGIAGSLPPLITSDWTFSTFASWFKRYRPDAILGIDQPLVEWIERCGARVPDDVGYANLDLTPNMGAISGMNQLQPEIGAGAIDLVISGLRRHERDLPSHPKTVLVEGVWSAGTTTRLQQIQKTKRSNKSSGLRKILQKSQAD